MESTIQKRKKVRLLGDSMVQGLGDKGLSKDHDVRVQSFRGYTTEDIIDVLKHTIHRKTEKIILHLGANDITNKINTLKKLKKVVKAIKESSEETEIIISGVIKREDGDYDKDITELNAKLKTYCSSNSFVYIDNENIDSSCLDRNKLHLNKKGSKLFSFNIIGALKN